ncbi:DNA topoisomerase IB [Streptomyces minutiscleroticus]|uniref:DNA topoisomerase n=1 Tax=Streptomyces minutiscleroticus TaxID=68238 RepID=A0A918NK37_9ACTN|nr:DNA topoisomerase IB [Streptomyces minutiscleroticus]GGX77274.1 DNA topoisomerase [Streptomyces minutiscleroticus]
MRLRTSDPRKPGLRRVRHGRGFRYLDADGRTVTDSEQLARLKALVIPPAWTDVWICPWPNGHLQATGKDAAGRCQYLYHEVFRAQQEAAKHEHVREVAAALPVLRERVAADLDGRGLTRDRVLACAVRLLDLGFFRIGSESYARDNQTYGLVTMLREHVTCGRGELSFDYPAKHGKQQSRALVDEAAFATVRALVRRRGGGDRLFEYWEGQRWHEVHSEDLNDCLRRLSGVEITAKDFRTWHATVLAAVGLAVSARMAGESQAARKRAVARVVREVSHYLGNTPAVCRASYINPKVVELFEEGVTIDDTLHRLGEGAQFGHPATQGAVEEAVRELLA